MRLRIIIDGMPHDCDTADPDLLGKWIVEIFGRMRQVTPATRIEFQALPSWLPQRSDMDGDWRPDWIADSRIIGQIRQIRSPRDLVAELGKMVDDYEELPR